MIYATNATDKRRNVCGAVLACPDEPGEPFCCGLDAGHAGPHVCDCGCGFTWPNVKSETEQQAVELGAECWCHA